MKIDGVEQKWKAEELTAASYFPHVDVMPRGKGIADGFTVNTMTRAAGEIGVSMEGCRELAQKLAAFLELYDFAEAAVTLLLRIGDPGVLAPGNPVGGDLWKTLRMGQAAFIKAGEWPLTGAPPVPTIEPIPDDGFGISIPEVLRRAERARPTVKPKKLKKGNAGLRAPGTGRNGYGPNE